MPRILGVSVLIGVVLAVGVRAAQRGPAPTAPSDPLVGAWRGTLRSGPDTQTTLVFSIVRKGDTYTGTTNVEGTAEAAIRRVAVTGNRVIVETAADSKLGEVVLAADLTIDGNKMTGGGQLSVGPHRAAVTIELQRRARADVQQPQVPQRAEYFVGRWTFEYLGGEFPPLSAGPRTGAATFTSGGPNIITGQIDGEVAGRKYQERLSMTFDPATKMLAVVERRPDATELISVASWQSPLAITFTTAPVQAGGRTYQLRRTMQVISETSFDIVEDFSVDGGPYRRLGNARFVKESRQ